MKHPACLSKNFDFTTRLLTENFAFTKACTPDFTPFNNDAGLIFQLTRSVCPPSFLDPHPHGLGESPAMAAGILRGVLSFAVGIVSRRADDLCTRLSGMFIMTVNLNHAHYDRKRSVRLVALSGHNNRTFPEGQLGTMISNPQPFSETEGRQSQSTASRTAGWGISGMITLSGIERFIMMVAALSCLIQISRRKYIGTYVQCQMIFDCAFTPFFSERSNPQTKISCRGQETT